MLAPVLVLDANILVRAVLGKKVRELLLAFSDSVKFFTPDICLADARKYLPLVFEKRSLPVIEAMNALMGLEGLLQVVEVGLYQAYEVAAKDRIRSRDVNDWPIVATALMLDSPVWTEDQDFFGSGLSVWTTDRIHIFFELVAGKAENGSL